MRYEDDFGSFWMVDDAEFMKRRHLSRGRPRKYEPSSNAQPPQPGQQQGQQQQQQPQQQQQQQQKSAADIVTSTSLAPGQPFKLTGNGGSP